jgi:hypothetical protein
MQKIVATSRGGAGRPAYAVRLSSETGAGINLDELNRQTREALIDLAAVVADASRRGPTRLAPCGGGALIVHERGDANAELFGELAARLPRKE